MFFRIKKAGGHEYLQVVQTKRVNGTAHQDVIASLGRLEYLIASGKLTSLVASGAKLIGQRLADSAVNTESIETRSVLSLQPKVESGHLQMPPR